MFCFGVCFFVLSNAYPHLEKARFLGNSHDASTLSSDVLAHSEFIDGATTNRTLFEEHPNKLVNGRRHKKQFKSFGPTVLKADVQFIESVKNSIGRIIAGIILFLIAFVIQLYHEERNVRVEMFLRRGPAECLKISPEMAWHENNGRLVHVQGLARAAKPLADLRFQDAQVTRCLKLKSTLEVFEWIEMTRTVLNGKEQLTQPCFETAWTTHHHDSQRFTKPSPKNPNLPIDINLGISTQVCPRIELGAFVLPKEMAESFLKFEPAMKYLPKILHADDFTFFANPEDGYYYMRPGVSFSSPNLITEHQVGDIRARFMCVPESEATIVAVQCQADVDGGGTFVPYRPFSHQPYILDWQAREKSFERDGKPLKEPKGMASCCTGRSCGMVLACCQSETVLEELFYASDQHDPLEHPFNRMVKPNLYRVWLFRLIGWGLMYLGIALVLWPYAEALAHIPDLNAYGSAAVFILSAMVTLAQAGCIMGLIYAFYQPIMILKWLLFVILVIIMPLLWARLNPVIKLGSLRA